MDDIYFEAMLSDRVILRPKQLHKGYVDEIKKILKSRVEERCGTYGYVKKNSVEIVQRPVGYVQQGYMNGCTTFDVNYKAMICNPVYGNVIKMKLSMIKMEVGLLFEDDFLSVVVPTDLEPDKSSFESLEEGDEVAIFVIDKQIQPDNTIMIVGKIYNEKTDKEHTVNIGDLKRSEEVKEMAMGDSDVSDSGTSDSEASESDASDSAFPDDAEDVDIETDSQGVEGVDVSDDDADSDEEKEIEVDDDGESAIEDDEEKDEDALAEKKAQMVADEDGDEDDEPVAGEVNDEESDSDNDDEFDYAD